MSVVGPRGKGRVVLVTGCSTGIGRASAEAFAARGWTVYASARRLEAIADLVDRGCRTLSLDVTDEESMQAAVATIEAESGGVDVLVNNAGYALYGPVEQQPLAEVRRQFETNVFGLVRMSQLVVAHMRDNHFGRIINVSSMGGRLTLPGGGFYHATKYAVESLSDALRVEVAPFGIDVVVVEPGPVRTPWNSTAASSIATADAAGDDPYAHLKLAVTAMLASMTEGPRRRLASSPEAIAAVIERAASRPHPRTRYLVGIPAHALVGLRAVLPDRLFDAVVTRAIAG
jgi:NAD(P)-dependent dehydrogenase (short-subunit alcohol dehydrogenase family)